MAQAAQMNYRIDAKLKAAGDLALGESGVSPSTLVRSVWGYLSRNRHAPDAVAKLMGFLESDGVSACKEGPTEEGTLEAEALVMAGPNLISQFLNDIGMQPTSLEPRSYEEMKLDAYSDKYPEIAQ